MALLILTKTEKNAFVIGRVTQYVLIKACHCMKSVQIRSFFYSIFFSVFGLNTEIYSVNQVRIRENTDQKKLRIWTLFTQCFLHYGPSKKVNCVVQN